MTLRARTTAVRGTGATALVLFVGLLALALPGAGNGPAAGPGRARTADVAEIHATLESLDAEAFRERARALLEERRTETARALILRAGSDDPPGVTGARAERRRTRREEGLALFREDLATGGPLIQELRALLALPSPAPGEADLLCAATRVVSRLGLRSLTTDVAWNLRDERPAEVREASQVALRELYGRWFSTREEFQVAWPRLLGRAPEELFVDEFKRLAERERELLGALLGYEPARADAVFEAGPPEARAVAARELVRAVRLKKLDIPVALERLRARLRVEVDPRAYQAAVDAALELLQGQAPDAPAIVELRALLEDLLAELTAKRPLERPELVASIVQALARLPWEMEAGDGERAQHVASGLAVLAETVRSLAEPERPVDYDRLSLAIESLRGLAQRSGLPPAERRSVVSSASRAVVDLALAGLGPLDARLDAARALDDFLDVEGLGRVLELLEPESRVPPSLRLHLLAAVERFAPALSPDSVEADAIRRVLGSSLRSEDVDIRRRALEMLAGEALAPHVAVQIHGAGRERLVEVLLDGFAADPSARNQELRLELLGRLGPDPELAARLGANPGFDALIAANGRGSGVLVLTLNRLVQGDAAAVMAAARRLAFPAVADPAAGTPGDPAAAPTADPSRRKLALRLVGGANAETLASLSIEDRTTILRWALAQQLDRRTGAPLPTELLPHVVEWVSRAEGSALEDPERVWARALFLADLSERQRAPGAAAVEGGPRVPLQEVRDAFARALLVAGTGGVPADPRVRLRRAYFLMTTEDPADAKAAAQDFGVLLAAAAEPGEDTGALVLLPDDLRKAAQAYGAAGQPLVAARVELRLVRLPAWESGAQEGHLEDLERLVGHALELGDAALVRGVRERLAELRTPDESKGAPSEVLRRLLEDPASLARLEQLTLRLAQAPAPRPPAGADEDVQKPAGGGLIPPGK